MGLSSAPFARLVSALKSAGNKTCTVVETCCGGLINASLLAQPGASAVYIGGSVTYNTRRSRKLLLDDPELHASLLALSSSSLDVDTYVQSKVEWTRLTSVAFCRALGTDYAVAENGASGPTFRPEGLDRGFAALAVAARRDDGAIEVVSEDVVWSDGNDREANMRLFADRAGSMVADVVVRENGWEGTLVEPPQAQPQPSSLSFSSSETVLQTPTWRPAALDRATHLRKKEATKELEALSADADYVITSFAGGGKAQALFAPGGDALRYFTRDEVRQLPRKRRADENIKAETECFLGLRPDGRAVFSVDVDLNITDNTVNLNAENDYHLLDVRTVGPTLPSTDDREIAMQAMALSQWHRRALCCQMCGAPMEVVDAGTCRRCTQCSTRVWPRQDPCAIVAVSSYDGQKLLLARSPRHPPGVHTVLAGFCEAGETLEQAVHREVHEETGVFLEKDRSSLSYVTSQPWPFPQSTMMGYLATATAESSLRDEDLRIDKDELVTARWFDRDQVRKAATVPGPTMQPKVAEAALLSDPTLELLIPPRGVVARTLIDAWLDRAPDETRR